MNKTYTIVLAILGVVLLLAVAVFRGQASRELILKRNGIPLANLKADVLPHGTGEAVVVATSTDANGRLDLSAVPAATEMIAITLRDDTGCVFNGDLVLPTGGSRTIDFRGNQTISSTTKTYADLGPFQVTERHVTVETRALLPSEAKVEATEANEPQSGPKQ